MCSQNDSAKCLRWCLLHQPGTMITQRAELPRKKWTLVALGEWNFSCYKFSLAWWIHPQNWTPWRKRSVSARHFHNSKLIILHCEIKEWKLFPLRANWVAVAYRHQVLKYGVFTEATGIENNASSRRLEQEARECLKVRTEITLRTQKKWPYSSFKCLAVRNFIRNQENSKQIRKALPYLEPFTTG